MTEHELWLPIEDFPGYSVSSFGRVMNDETGRYLNLSSTSRDAAKVGLVYEGKQYTRSVKNLVGDAFLPLPQENFNTTINKDGDKSNNAADNLVWRPRWFAVKYAMQFNEDYQHTNTGPIRDVDENLRYARVYDASVANGLLFRDVFSGCLSGEPVFPTWQIFEWLH